MSKMRKGVVLVAVAVLVSAFAYYRFAAKILKGNEGVAEKPVAKPADGTREASAVVSYMATEDKKDTLRFTVTTDKDGVITGVTVVDPATNETPEKKKEFSEQLIMIIKGKKLSELGSIDKVGTSSLTTKAFNDALGDLKSQL